MKESFSFYGVNMKVKKIFTRIFLSCGFLMLIPLALFGASTWHWMWRTVGLREGETCIQSYQAVSKGTFWDRGEWHHYVDFTVDVSQPEDKWWRVVHAPMPSSVLYRQTEGSTVRVTYRWPSNWVDPFPLDSWEICMLEPRWKANN